MLRIKLKRDWFGPGATTLKGHGMLYRGFTGEIHEVPDNWRKLLPKDTVILGGDEQPVVVSDIVPTLDLDFPRQAQNELEARLARSEADEAAKQLAAKKAEVAKKG